MAVLLLLSPIASPLNDQGALSLCSRYGFYWVLFVVAWRSYRKLWPLRESYYLFPETIIGQEDIVMRFSVWLFQKEENTRKEESEKEMFSFDTLGFEEF